MVLARVLESRVEAPENDPRRMQTITTVEVIEELKGKGPGRLEIVQLGGRLGPWEAHVSGDAKFNPGESAVLLLRCEAADRCRLMALAEGKLTVAGDELLIPSIARGSVSRRSLASVRAEIASAVAEPAKVRAPGASP